MKEIQSEAEFNSWFVKHGGNLLGWTAVIFLMNYCCLELFLFGMVSFTFFVWNVFSLWAGCSFWNVLLFSLNKPGMTFSKGVVKNASTSAIQSQTPNWLQLGKGWVPTSFLDQLQSPTIFRLSNQGTVCQNLVNAFSGYLGISFCSKGNRFIKYSLIFEKLQAKTQSSSSRLKRHHTVIKYYEIYNSNETEHYSFLNLIASKIDMSRRNW